MSEPDAAPSSPEAVRWLAPDEVSATWDPAAARLTVKIGSDEEIADARAAMAFPVSAPDRYVDIRDKKNESVGMLRSLKDLEGASCKAIEAALEARYLIPRVERIVEIVETAAFVLHWQVETDRGPRLFHTESPREAVKYQGPDRIRITDLTGNHYDVPSISALDAASRGMLDAYL